MLMLLQLGIREIYLGFSSTNMQFLIDTGFLFYILSLGYNKNILHIPHSWDSEWCIHIVTTSLSSRQTNINSIKHYVKI